MLGRLVEAGNFLTMLFYLALAGVVTVIMSKTIRNLVTQMNKLQNEKRLRDSMSYDVFSVEGEVINFTTTKVGPMDTQYDAQVMYIVGNTRYYKDVVFHNRGSLRVGARVTLLCDSEDPSNAVLQGEEQEDTLKGLIFALVVEIGISLYLIFGLFFEIRNI
ncbi:MAG: hypothetical protein J1F09_00200 [Oscillospiraceae bacterium]|nr:hypothetical protein [Oscillospiraceae bacterium]